MIKSKTHKLLIALIVICTCGVVLSEEPNKAETELKFDIRQGLPQLKHLRLKGGATQELYTHYAVLFVKGKWSNYGRSVPIEEMLETSAGQSMSKRQREVISNRIILYYDDGNTISNYTYFQLLGVSEDDTKKMVEAFIEVLANKTNKQMQLFLSKRQKYQKEIDEIQKELPEKQKQYDEATEKYNEVKNARYFPQNPQESYRKAMDTIFQMDKTLDILEIELAGIRGKLDSIESYRRTKRLPRKDMSDVTVDKLDQMFIEQVVELTGVETRKEAALRIRRREKEFLVLFDQQGNLEIEVNELKNSLRMSENNLRSVEKTLADPGPEMLPPKVFQNKVNIYPLK